MNRADAGGREVAVPAPALGLLRLALQREAGALAAVHGLHAAGYGAGAPLYDAFARGRQHPGELPRTEFWRALTRFLEQRGWGVLDHSAPHPGVGLLSSANWAEAEGTDDPHAACAFSTGLLSHLLSRAAEAPVAVLEVNCRARGDDACRFAYGSQAAIHDLYGLLLDGRSLDRALEEL